MTRCGCILLLVLALGCALALAQPPPRRRAVITAFLKATGYPQGRPGYVVDLRDVAPDTAIDYFLDMAGQHTVLVAELFHTDRAGCITSANSSDDARVEASAEGALSDRRVASALSGSIDGVVFVRTDKEMRGIYTGGVVAAMQDQQSGGDRVVCEKPRNTVCFELPVEQPSTPERSWDAAVTAYSFAGPQPTRVGFRDMVPEVFDGILHLLADRVTVVAAESTGPRWRSQERRTTRVASTDQRQDANTTTPVRRSRPLLEAFKKLTGYHNGRPGYVIDHVLPLCSGGLDEIANLQWQERQASYRKDVFERQLCAAMKRQGFAPMVKQP